MILNQDDTISLENIRDMDTSNGLMHYIFLDLTDYLSRKLSQQFNNNYDVEDYIKFENFTSSDASFDPESDSFEIHTYNGRQVIVDFLDNLNNHILSKNNS